MPILLRLAVGLLMAILSWGVLPRPGHRRSLAAGVFELNIVFVLVFGLFLLIFWGWAKLIKVHKALKNGN